MATARSTKTQATEPRYTARNIYAGRPYHSLTDAEKIDRAQRFLDRQFVAMLREARQARTGK